MTTGRTLDETKINIREAIQGNLNTLREVGDPIPQPASLETTPSAAHHLNSSI